MSNYTTTNRFAFLPGTIIFEPGTSKDYRELERHHYRIRPPRTWAYICVARFVPRGKRSPGRLVAVGVLSWPIAMHKTRMVHFNLPTDYGTNARFANENLRTISRVIVHPQFRAIGLAREIVRRLIEACPTPYVEASAVMGRFAKFFTSAGMVQIDSDPEKPAYFLYDKQSEQA